MLLLIPLLPFLGFVVNAFFGRRLPKRLSGGIACASILGSFAVAAASSWSVISHHQAIEQTVFAWITSGDLDIPLAFRLDNLSVLMVLVVTGIGSLIHIYSTGYMHEETDPEYARYFSYLNLFASFMLILVLGASFPVMFVGWEGVGLCSYLLIGFWFRKQSAADAGKKAFVVNRVGDFGFILGMLLLFWQFGTLDFQGVATAASTRAIETAGMGVLTVATLLLFLGAAGKSAQIPLYVWLPDAMEGPTPVSALIHAATMVTAGVYMIGRNAVLFEHAPITLAVVAAIGTATALMAGTIGLVQNDIKRVLAYSTVSQLGYMFLAMGVGAYAAGIFHLYTHAFFKALLFLGSGAVIHALHGEQDMRHMGGLKKYLPITYWTFLVGTLAIAGAPLLSGFFSKDEILWKTYTAEWPTFHLLLYGIALFTAFLTATYMFRLFFMTFHGPSKHVSTSAPGTSAHSTSHVAHSTSHVHDAPPLNGVCAHRAGDRVGVGRLRRRTARTRRRESHRDVPPSKLYGHRHGTRGRRCRGCSGRRRAPRRYQHRTDVDGAVDRRRGRRVRPGVVFLVPQSGERCSHAAAFPGRARPAAEQVLRGRALRCRRGSADQGGVYHGAVERGGCQWHRLHGERRGHGRAGQQLDPAAPADRIDPRLRGVALPGRRGDPRLLPL